ncbi:hypothetical protein Tco_0988723 [Tanacetum coccineum]|uniref:Xylulose kinase-1 n=1 Tax=Tanacetum coccineum TaxID=301880 RepID=A0ABQ5ES49_9ASTR
MVAYLEKSDENAEFHQIVDFLSTCSINYALTISPTIYASYIEQFWNVATSKTVNSVKQIHAIVDGKAVVITELSVRNDLLFDDEDGITCLTNDEIYENLALIGQSKGFSGKVTLLFNSMLVQNHAPEGEGSAIPPESQPTPSISQPTISEPQTAPLQTETPLTVSYEPQTKAHIEQILPSPSTYHRKHRKTQKHRRAKKVTELPQTSVPLDLRADEVIHKERGDSVERAITADASLVAAHDQWQSQVPRNHRGALAQTRFERVLEKPNEPPLPEGHTFGSEEGSMEHTFELMDTLSPTPHDSPLPGGYTLGSDEGRLKLKELMAMCTKLSKHVLDLEKEKDAQAVEILKLKQRVNKLERKRKSSISHPRRRIYNQVVSSDDNLDEKDASKQGRESDKTKSMFQDSDFDVLDDDMKDVEGETVHTATTGVSAVSAPVTTAGVAISTAEPRTPPTTAATAFIDKDLTIAHTLVKMRSEKENVKGVTFRDVEETPRLTRSTTTLQPLPTIDPKDKCKGVLVEEEPEKPEKVKIREQGLAQIESVAELAQRLHEEELAELDRAQKEKQKQEEATNAALAEEFDEI